MKNKNKSNKMINKHYFGRNNDRGEFLGYIGYDGKPLKS